MKTRRDLIIFKTIAIKLTDNEVKNLRYSVQGELKNTENNENFPYILVANYYYKKTKVRQGQFIVQGYENPGFYIAVSKKDHQNLKKQTILFKKFKEYSLCIYS